MAANVNRRNRIDQQLWSPHYFQRLYQRKHLTRDWPTFWLAIAMLIAFITSCLLQSCLAHVALTYPPARKYNLDFLDNSRTKGPCGMPKGLEHTSLLSGSKLNVTWHLAYPHRISAYEVQMLSYY